MDKCGYLLFAVFDIASELFDLLFDQLLSMSGQAMFFSESMEPVLFCSTFGNSIFAQSQIGCYIFDGFGTRLPEPEPVIIAPGIFGNLLRIDGIGFITRYFKHAMDRHSRFNNDPMIACFKEMMAEPFGIDTGRFHNDRCRTGKGTAASQSSDAGIKAFRRLSNRI